MIRGFGVPSEFWTDVDPEWAEIHPDLVQDVFNILLTEMEAGGYIGPAQTGGPDHLPQAPLFDEDEDEPEPEPPRRRRRRRRHAGEPPRPAIIERVTSFFRRLFRGR